MTCIWLSCDVSTGVLPLLLNGCMKYDNVCWKFQDWTCALSRNDHQIYILVLVTSPNSYYILFASFFLSSYVLQWYIMYWLNISSIYDLSYLCSNLFRERYRKMNLLIIHSVIFRMYIIEGLCITFPNVFCLVN